jgi:hypothetical protein
LSRRPRLTQGCSAKRKEGTLRELGNIRIALKAKLNLYSLKINYVTVTDKLLPHVCGIIRFAIQETVAMKSHKL